jgi:hypothetical protein
MIIIISSTITANAINIRETIYGYQQHTKNKYHQKHK